MKTITLTVCNRPDYTAQCLDALSRNDVRGYELFICCEPDQAETLAVCQKHSAFMPTQIIVHKERLGINYNNKAMYDLVFKAGSEFNVALEDDGILSPDAFDLVQWWFRRFRNEPEPLLLCLAGGFDETRPLDVEEEIGFFRSPWGHCFGCGSWQFWLKPYWNWKQDHPHGWDHSISTMMKNKGLKALYPALSRCHNIGREKGVYCTPEVHDQLFAGQKWATGEYGNDFRLVRQEVAA